MSGASWLFVPGNRPDRFGKAAAAGAHDVIIDLEDAVVASEKVSARDSARAWLSGGGTAWVRVNAIGTVWHDADVDALTRCHGLRGVMAPKADEPAPLTALARRLGNPIIALVETAVGVHAAQAIAGCEAVSRIAFGSIDFALDIDADDADESLLLARSTLVLASRAAGLAPPLDGVTRTTTDTVAVQADAERARRLGFGGKLCIHPSQVPMVNRTFAPRDSEIEWARSVLARRSESAFAHDGQLVDQPVLARAARILARAQ